MNEVTETQTAGQIGVNVVLPNPVKTIEEKARELFDWIDDPKMLAAIMSEAQRKRNNILNERLRVAQEQLRDVQNEIGIHATPKVATATRRVAVNNAGTLKRERAALAKMSGEFVSADLERAAGLKNVDMRKLINAGLVRKVRGEITPSGRERFVYAKV